MKTNFLMLALLFYLPFFSQQQQVFTHVELISIQKSIVLHDSLLDLYHREKYLTEIHGSNDKGDHVFRVKTLEHLREFYESKQAFLHDSLHCKEQLTKIREERLKETYLGCCDGGGGQIIKVLSAARKAKEKRETEKALELYRRYLLFKPDDAEVRKECEELKELQNKK